MAVSVAEILEQVKTLTVQERKAVSEAIKAMVSADQNLPVQVVPEGETHWGKNLLRLLDELGPIELAHPEIEDAVEWVATMRREEREHRLGDLANWGEDFDAGEDAT